MPYERSVRRKILPPQGRSPSPVGHEGLLAVQTILQEVRESPGRQNDGPRSGRVGVSGSGRMIAASKHRLVEAGLTGINRGMLRRAFNAVLLGGRQHVEALDRRRPIIGFGNHSCWWDGLIEFFLSRALFRFDAFLMMDETQLARYRFFRSIGAFSVNRSSPREAIRSLEYAVGLFDRPNRMLWIYPQGVMRPNDARPLAFEQGVVRIARALPGAQLLPVTHRYEFVREQRPDAFVTFGPALPLPKGEDPKVQARFLETVLTGQLDALRAAVARGEAGQFEVVLRGRRSTNVGYDLLRGESVQS
jgi:chlorobactene lauroyltransferase